MKQEERDALLEEAKNLDEKMKAAAFISPKDMRRRGDITSLLMTNGASEDLRFKAGPWKKSKRVTSFSRDRR